MSALSLVAAQEQFTATLSAVEDAVHYAFRRRLRPQEYEEALAEARAAAWSAWHGLVQRGKDPVEVGVHGIAANAIRWVRARRKVGNTNCGRGAMDVYHPRAQAACGFTLVSLDSGDEVDAGDSTRGSWREWLSEDNRVTPADEAAFRLDFEGWLIGLPERKRRVAELLAEGHEGVVVARTVGIAPSRVTQLRSELAASWRAFQGQAEGGPRRAAVATA
jgi:hypothetical protein